ncbi:archease, partial [Candidatus Woesearchaeota archaeon]|nr:archease [Candidatus Woesearchaeota archaeon]
MPAKGQKGKGDTQKGYRYLPDVATADVCFEATGKTLEELFTNAGLATEEVMVDLQTIKPSIKQNLTIEQPKIDNLLYEFLEELIFLKDRDLLLCNKFKLKITKRLEKYKLTGILCGEHI